ncbi:MAG: class I SAM-dependent methyltransferase, partial [Gammaproteobacteria bacterium]|nr:class I SAM-dependent methyltransferase [Gammaproteobacteria bacterium]
DWITSIADRGIIEFVPKSDPTVKEMLSMREDIFPDYNELSFAAALGRYSTIVKKEKISMSGRVLYEYKKSE